MDLSRTKLSLLIVFDAIARTRSVTHAAEEMGVTQPALSHSLARLRKMFNDPLFVRGMGRLVLTPKAEAMVGPVRGLLESATSILQRPEFDPATSDKELRIGLSECSMVMVGMPALVRLRAEAPSMRVTMEIVDRLPDRSVREGPHDMGLWYADEEPPALLSEPLIVDRYVGVVNGEHPLAAQCRDGVPVSAEQYTSYRHIHTVLRGHGGDHVADAVSEAGLSRIIEFIGSSFVMILPLLTVSHAIAVVPSRMAEAARRMSLELVTFELPFEVQPISYRLLWSPRTDKDAPSAWVRQVFREAAAQPQAG